MSKNYGNGSKSDVERAVLDVPGVTAFHCEVTRPNAVHIYVDGGYSQDIAKAVSQNLVAGIETEGPFSGQVKGEREIRFSRGAAYMNEKKVHASGACEKKWQVSCAYSAPGTFEKVPGEEYQRQGGPSTVNPAMNLLTEICKILEVTPSTAQISLLTTCLEDLLAPQYVVKVPGWDDAAMVERFNKMETARSTARTLWDSEYNQQPSSELSPDEVASLDQHVNRARSPSRISDYVNITITKTPVSVPSMFLKFPEEETIADKIVNMTGPAFGVSELRASYSEEDVEAPFKNLYQSRAVDQVMAAGTFQKIVAKVDEQALSDLAEEMANYTEELEDSFYDLKTVARQNGMWERLYRTPTSNSKYNADPLAPGYGQPALTGTPNGTSPGFPIPTAPASPGTVCWDSPLSGNTYEVIKNWGEALGEPGFNVVVPPVTNVCAEVAKKPTLTTMYLCLSHGCPERAPVPQCGKCYTCNKIMTEVLVEEVVEATPLPKKIIDPTDIQVSFNGVPFVGFMDSEFVTHERAPGVIDVKNGVLARMDSI